MKQSPRQLKEAHKAYEKIVDYLIAENYAGNKKDADTIISGCLLYTSDAADE